MEVISIFLISALDCLHWKYEQWSQWSLGFRYGWIVDFSQRLTIEVMDVGTRHTLDVVQFFRLQVKSVLLLYEQFLEFIFDLVESVPD